VKYRAMRYIVLQDADGQWDRYAVAQEVENEITRLRAENKRLRDEAACAQQDKL
jgi:hypothetical protein